MNTPPLVSPTIVNSIGDFEQVLIIAKRHGVTHLKLGSIEAVIAATAEPVKEQATRPEGPSDLNAEAFMVYSKL